MLGFGREVSQSRRKGRQKRGRMVALVAGEADEVGAAATAGPAVGG